MTSSKLPRRIFIIQAAAGMAALVQGCSRPETSTPSITPAASQPTANAAPAATKAPATAAQNASAPAESPVGFVSESDPTAASLGFKLDAAQVEAKKFPSYAPGQRCASCSLFLAKEGVESAGCALFPGKNVYAKSWCTAYSKKSA